MSFSRKSLKDAGLSEEQIDKVFALHTSSVADMVSKSDVQAQIDTAVAESAKNQKYDATQSDEYKALQGKYSELEALGSDEFNVVKKPYKEMVWSKLDHGEKHKPYAEQMSALAETMPDLFVPQEEPKEPEPKKPLFGAQTEGSVPTGKQAPSFMDTWGFIPKKG